MIDRCRVECLIMASTHVRLEQAQPWGEENCAAECCEGFEEGTDVGRAFSARDEGKHGMGRVRGLSVMIEV